MVDVSRSTRINTDASENDLAPGEYRDALNISLIASEAGKYSKGTTFGNIDTDIVFIGLQPDSFCLGTAVDVAGRRIIVIFYQVNQTSLLGEVLMYLLETPISGDKRPLVKSSQMSVNERSYLDGYSFVNDLFFFNLRGAAPKVINITRCQDTPGFYDTVDESLLTVMKPHPPYAPTGFRELGIVVNAPIQKKPFQFMILYRFIDGEQSTKSPASEYFNSLDDIETLTSTYDHIKLTLSFPIKDFPIIDTVELYVRNTNNIADWRGVNIFSKELFVKGVENYTYDYNFRDDVVGNFLPLEIAQKINDAVPRLSNYEAFIENRLFLIDSLIDYNINPAFQIQLVLDSGNAPLPDDRVPVTPLYTLAELEHDSEYMTGIVFYDRFGRKYPSTTTDKKLVTDPFIPFVLPAADEVPSALGTISTNRKKITYKYDLRAATDIAEYGVPPKFAYWWSFIRSKNTKWEFQQSIQCLLRFPYSIVKWADPTPASWPANTFMEDGYLYWDIEKLLSGNPGNFTVNDYIDIVVPPNFPHSIDKNVLIDFMLNICGQGAVVNIQITNREVVDIFANKIRIRGDRNALWWGDNSHGHYRLFPKFTTGVNLIGGQNIRNSETTFPIVIKRLRQNNLENLILYDTPQVYPINNAGTDFAAFQPSQIITITRTDYPSIFGSALPNATLAQGTILVQPIQITPASAATLHAVKITWAANPGDQSRLRIRVSIWSLDNQNNPVKVLGSATKDSNGTPYRVGNGTTVEYAIADIELIAGWYGYGLEILHDDPPVIQFENPDFDDYIVLGELAGWEQSIEGASNLLWKRGSVGDNFAYANISAMAGGWTKTIYQYLQEATKEEVRVEVVIEAVGVKGPLSNSAVTQYPGNSGAPAVTNSIELLTDLGSNIVPYFIDCDTVERKVTLLNLNYVVSAGGAPANCVVRAQLWSLNQTTKEPISLISRGAATPLPVVAGPASAPFAAGTIIDTTGWYGIALFFDGPTSAVITDFTNKNYDNGGAGWTVTQERLPTWVFQDNSAGTGPVYDTPTLSPTHGASIGEVAMSASSLVQPIFFPASVDPTGYDNHQIKISWGDNVYNTWDGSGYVDVVIFDVDQVTKKPTSYIPIATTEVTVHSSMDSIHLITNAFKLAGNKWYAFGLRNLHGNGAPARVQFNNPDFFTNSTGWTIGGPNWVYNPDGDYMKIELFTQLTGFFDSGYISQTLEGVAQVVLTDFYASISLPAGQFLSVVIYLNGSPKQVINLNPADGPFYNNIIFDPIWVYGGVVNIRIYSSVVPTSNVIIVHIGGIFNSFNQYLYSSPKIVKYAVSDANYEAWGDYAGMGSYVGGVIDDTWSELYTYWKKTTHGQTDPSVTVDIGRKSNFGGSSNSAPNVSLGLRARANTKSDMVYGRVNMTDAPGMEFKLSIKATSFIDGGSTAIATLQVWLFNDPNTFDTTGYLLQSINFTPNMPPVDNSNISVNFPGGYKFIGYRTVGNADLANTSYIQLNLMHYAPTVVYHSWYKEGNVLGISAIERQKISDGTPVVANFHVDNIPTGAISGRIGQNNLYGVSVRATINLFTGAASNNYDLILTDTSGFELGRTSVVGQALNVDQVVNIAVINVPTTSGLFFSIQSYASSPLSARIKQITNIPVDVYLDSDNTIANAKTWRVDSSNNKVQLTTTTKTSVSATQDTPGPPQPITVVLADAGGTEISSQQTFDPSAGVTTLIFDPTLQANGNFNYGVKVKNNPGNQQTAGTIRIRSIRNIKSNTSSASILVYNVSVPAYNARIQVLLGAFALAGYTTNFIAVANALASNAFIPAPVTPTSFHLVANIVSEGVSGHSDATNAGGSSIPYNYGFPYPSASSDPDAYGLTYESKVGQSIGDINLRVIDIGEKSRSNIVRWSDPIIVGTRTNNTNAFTDGNQYNVDFQRGEIRAMFTMHDHTLFCIHTQGMSSLYVGRSVVTSVPDIQSEQLFLTNKVIGNDNKLISNLGTINPESCKVVESGTIAYGFDLIRKSLWQKTNNGVRNLTYECNAKNLFNKICFYRLRAFNDGEDVKIYAGYNEKLKTFYLTFAPFMYKGVQRPGITVAYCAYIDGFLSRYSFEPMNYLATEDVLYLVEPRGVVNPDFFGDFSVWKQIPVTGDAKDWHQSTTLTGTIEADTTAPAGTRILNPDFMQAATSWSTYGAGTAWVFLSNQAQVTIPAGGASKDLVNVAGAPATYRLRFNSDLPVAGLTYTIKVYDGAGNPVQTLQAATPFTGEAIVSVTQTLAGRIGVIFNNPTGAAIALNLNLFSTVVMTHELYQAVPLAAESVRIRLNIPARTGSIKLFIYTFDSLSAPTLHLIHEVSYIHNKDAVDYTVNVPNPATTKYIGFVAVSDYNLTLIDYFNINSVPSIWAHDQDGRTNNFFGTQYDSMIKLIFNVQFGMVKIFNNLGVESEKVWSAEVIETSEGQLSALEKANFRLRDGIYSATIMRDMLTPQDALPDPVNNRPITHGQQLFGTWLSVILRNDETLKQIQIRAVYLGGDELAGNFLNKK